MSNTINKASFKFRKFTILESYFHMTDRNDFDMNIKIDPRGFLSEKDKTFILEQEIEISEDSGRFKINIKSSAEFSFDEIPKDEADFSFFIINAPAIVFPYIRSYVSTLTTLSGLSTITLPTLNLFDMSEVLKNNIQIVE